MKTNIICLGGQILFERPSTIAPEKHLIECRDQLRKIAVKYLVNRAFQVRITVKDYDVITKSFNYTVEPWSRLLCRKWKEDKVKSDKEYEQGSLFIFHSNTAKYTEWFGKLPTKGVIIL